MSSATVGASARPQGIDDEHVLADRGVAPNHLARGEHVTFVVADDLGAERARSGRDDDGVRPLGEDVAGPRLGAQPYLDPELRELALEEEDDLLEIVTGWSPHDQIHLAAEARPALEQHDFVPASKTWSCAG